MFDRVILSTNEDNTYYEFWPYVAKAWKHLFNVKVSLAVVTDKPESDPWIVDLKQHGDVVLFPLVDRVPTPNLAQVVRHILASQYGDEVCMINDIDLLPLQRDWYLKKLAKRKHGQLLAIGADFFVGKADEGKFPMGYVTADGNTWKEIVNPRNLTYDNLVKSWIGLNMFDHKEDVSRTIYHENKDAFADESLMRVWLHVWNHPECIVHCNWEYKPAIDSVDRSKWNVNLDDLCRMKYVESHMLRPFSKHRDKLMPLFDFVNTL